MIAQSTSQNEELQRKEPKNTSLGKLRNQGDMRQGGQKNIV